ncbi:site-specific integrase [Nodosilinea sp. LEGE 07298]|uniref:site-specific integrase n=1 Tax=Nodosilinea sp. LEGE 07298 TaxID=2777970 RepID=UPI00188307EE|nr:site-specific integrase [Nodosilinea sp. LEGE 07298]MBE9113246.1 site-specific integrase [Nodosilinea sp. LEGE 07298]
MSVALPHYVVDAYVPFKASEGVILNPKSLGNLKTALRLYVLPSYGFEADRLQTDRDLEVALGQVTLKAFLDAPDRLRSSEAAQRSVGTMANYRSAINRFLGWMQQQSWFRESVGRFEEMLSPPTKVAGLNLRAARRGTGKDHGKKRLSLAKTELTETLQLELADLFYFLTAPEVAKRQDEPIREVTFNNYEVMIRGFLGWLYRVVNVSRQELSLALIADREWLDEYMAWGISDRDNSYGWALNVAAASLNVAKWLYHQQSVSPKYRDIQEVELIRAKMAALQSKREKEPRRRVSKEKMVEKFVPFDQVEGVVRYLRLCCATTTAKGYARKDLTVMHCWQIYLIIAILAYCPVRQREVRELELGRTLLREKGGYVVLLEPEDHKTGSFTGKGREFCLPDLLTQDLDEWLNVWRPKLKPTHDRVLMKLRDASSGSFKQPYDDAQLSGMVARAMYRATGILFDDPKKTTPHDFRRIAITWQRKYGDRDQDQALAELMGHSVEEVNRTYNQMSGRDRTAKAQEWWKVAQEL